MTTSSALPSGPVELHDVIVDVGNEIAAIIESSPSGDKAIPRMSWTVAETAAHLASANGHMAQIAADMRPSRHGDGTAAGLAAANQQLLDEVRERDLAVLARDVATQVELFVQAARRRPPTDIVDTPLGPMPMEVLSGYLLAHMLSHGTAIADAVGKPTIVRPKHVELVVPFLLTVLPRLVKTDRIAGVRLRYEVRLRGGTRFTALIADGAATVDDGAGPVDCVISADPVAFFLLAMGNRRQWPLILAGKLTCRGRRPWLATRFVGFFGVP